MGGLTVIEFCENILEPAYEGFDKAWREIWAERFGLIKGVKQCQITKK